LPAGWAAIELLGAEVYQRRAAGAKATLASLIVVAAGTGAKTADSFKTTLLSARQ
jgi:hypothetical protein